VVVKEMSIRKRLILSNIAMIIIPIFFFIVIEIILGVFLYHFMGGWDGNQNWRGNRDWNAGEVGKTFIITRFVGLLLALIITNGILTYFVSKSIIKPVKKLSEAAQQISEGNLDFKIEPINKDELGKLADTFEQMRSKLKESAELQKKYEENRKELIANISHDLKTPITSIKGYVEGIQDGVANTPEKMDRYIKTIYTKAVDMDHLIDELFLYSKLDLHRVPFHFEEIDIMSYLLDFVEELRFDIEKDGMVVTFDAEQDASYKVIADREQLKRVTMNIIQNSLKHMDKEEKRVQIFLKERPEDVLVQIQDNGLGIPVDDLPYIFDRFYKADPSRNTATGGSGLGLAIVKRIVEEHGGEIWAESKLGEGTSIFFTLKKSQNEDDLNEQDINS
jgi:signal transduction histidine kinase